MIDQFQILNWAARMFGPIARNRDERAARVAEEAIEVAQVEGVPLDVILRIAQRVYERPPGELAQETGGLVISLMAFAANADISLIGCAEKEWQRVLSKTPEHWQRRHAEKVAAGTADLSPIVRTTYPNSGPRLEVGEEL